MAIAMRGLRLRPTYEQLIGVAVSDELRNMKFPNRDAKFLRDGFLLSQTPKEPSTHILRLYYYEWKITFWLKNPLGPLFYQIYSKNLSISCCII